VKKLFAAAAIAALAIAGSASATELLTNGTFDAGNTGFQSEYVYAVTHDLWPEGTYDVITNPQADHSSFSAFADHRPGDDTGLMMVINGSGTADKVIWSQGTVENPLIGAANTEFTFSFWLASVYPSSPANLNLWINGEKLNGVNFAALGGESNLGAWQNFSYSGVSGAGGIASIWLTNNNLEPSGNDFALDDMSLSGTAVPEPSSWALMLLGFGGLGAMLRTSRRRAMAVATA
jgi:hypothetical protein